MDGLADNLGKYEAIFRKDYARLTSAGAMPVRLKTTTGFQ